MERGVAKASGFGCAGLVARGQLARLAFGPDTYVCLSSVYMFVLLRVCFGMLFAAKLEVVHLWLRPRTV